MSLSLSDYWDVKQVTRPIGPTPIRTLSTPLLPDSYDEIRNPSPDQKDLPAGYTQQDDERYIEEQISTLKTIKEALSTAQTHLLETQMNLLDLQIDKNNPPLQETINAYLESEKKLLRTQVMRTTVYDYIWHSNLLSIENQNHTKHFEELPSLPPPVQTLSLPLEIQHLLEAHKKTLPTLTADIDKKVWQKLELKLANLKGNDYHTYLFNSLNFLNKKYLTRSAEQQQALKNLIEASQTHKLLNEKEKNLKAQESLLTSQIKTLNEAVNSLSLYTRV